MTMMQLWYRDLIEKCNSEPDKIHSVTVEQGFLSDEQYKQLLLDHINQLHLLPKNAQLMVFFDGELINLTDYQLKLAEDEKAWSELKKRFNQIDFPNFSQTSRNSKTK